MVDKVDIYSQLTDAAKNNDNIKWNKFRRINRKLDIEFNNEDFSNLNFTNFNLKGVKFINCNLSNSKFEKCILNNSSFEKSNCFATIILNSNIVSSNFSQTKFSTSKIIDSDLRYSNFDNSSLHQMFILNSKLDYSSFLGASIKDSTLDYSSFNYSNLKDAEIIKSDLHNASFKASHVNGSTIFWTCYYNKETDFTGVGLNDCRIEPILSSSFKCNIRRIWWKKWYREKQDFNMDFKKHFFKHPIKNFIYLLKYISYSLMTYIVRLFWWTTDYGSSTIRLLLVFIITSISFSLVYGVFPELTNDIILQSPNSLTLLITRSIYFSIIVMTGLGFGEIHAAPDCSISHIVITSQTLLGFILLGAFLVRIGILFQGEFPVSPYRYRK